MTGIAFLRDSGSRWAKLLGTYFSAQAVVQLTGVLAGFLLVRYLPIGEFALYTLAASMTTLIAVSSDLGSTASLLHFYRTAKTSGERFEDYVGAVLELRRTIFLVGAIALPTAALFVGVDHGFGRRQALLAALLVLATSWLQIGSSVRLVLLRLAARYGVAYRAELAGSLLRLTLVALLLLVSQMSAITALGAATIAAIAVFVLSGSGAAHLVAGNRSLARRRLFRYLLPTLPSALYFAVQGPLMIWLAATFGDTRNIAEIGALGRIGMILGLISGLSGAVLLPRLAADTDQRTFAARFLGYGGLLVALLGAVCLLAAVAPGPFLWLLGSNYRGLDRELVLLLIGSSIAALGAYVGGVNFVRGWVRFQSLTLVGEVAIQAFLLSILSLGTTTGVLWFQVGSALAGLVFQLGIIWGGLRRPELVSWR